MLISKKQKKRQEKKYDFRKTQIHFSDWKTSEQNRHA